MATLEEIRSRLEAERVRLQRQVAEVEGVLPAYDGSPTESRYGNHAADQATDTFEEEKALALRAHFQAELNEVEHALRRVEDGKYGRCERCGQEIDPARLEAMPAARLCISCQTLVAGRR